MTATYYTNANLSYGSDDLVTQAYTEQKFPLGLYREEDGKGYRFVKQNDATVTVTANSLAYHVGGTAATAYVVCQDVSDSDRNLVLGVYQSVIPDAGYGWIQTKGPSTVNTNGDDDIAAGDAVIASAAGDGTADSTAQDTAPICKVVGWAMAADSDSANTVLTMLTLE